MEIMLLWVYSSFILLGCANNCFGEDEKVTVDDLISQNSGGDYGLTGMDVQEIHAKVIDESELSDIDSVSGYIKEFQKKFKEEQEATQQAKDPMVAADEEGTEPVQGEGVAVENDTASVNVTLNATQEANETTNATSNLVSCNLRNETGIPAVEVVNSSVLTTLLISDANITNRDTPAECVALLFYTRWCQFSALAAPHFSALPRAFPDIKMVAVDAMKHHSFNTQYGVVGVPTVLLFHNGRPAAKFNDSEYTLDMLAKFITKYTGLEPLGLLNVTSADFMGPIPTTPTNEMDFWLVLSWIFIVLCCVYYFMRSSWWTWIMETIQNTWRDTEAHHEHVE